MNLPLAPLAAATLGVAAALGVLAMPLAVLESMVMDSGLPAVLAAAEPPLGFTARAMLALGAGGIAALLGWFIAFVLVGTRWLTVGKPAEAEAEAPHMPVLRRADAHPDAPPRPPLLATRDLGTPFLEVRAADNDEEGTPVDDALATEAASVTEPETRSEPQPEPETLNLAPAAIMPPLEQPLPEDFDQPLAAFDPTAIPSVPRPKPVPLAPLRRASRPAVFDDTERFEIFELTPPVRPQSYPEPLRFPAPAPTEAIARPETDASVHALLERLERGVVRKGLATGMEREARPRDAERGLEDALVTLRNLARRA